MATDIIGLVDAERGLVSKRIFIEQDIYLRLLYWPTWGRCPGTWTPSSTAAKAGWKS